MPRISRRRAVAAICAATLGGFAAAGRPGLALADVSCGMARRDGGGAVTGAAQVKPRDVAWVGDFGTLGAGRDAAIFQAAIDAVAGSRATLLIPGNTTIALGCTGVTISGAIRIVGVGGRNRTYITWTGTTMTAVSVESNAAVEFEGITFSGPASCTAGAAISLSGNGAGIANKDSRIRDCAFAAGYCQIYAPDAYVWEISANAFSAAVASAIHVGNASIADAGDSTISNNVFANGGVACDYIYQVSSGGLRIINNKINQGRNGYLMELGAGKTTSILIITGNSIENQSASGIQLLNSAGTGSFSQVIINGNQLAYQRTPINLSASPSFCLAAIISGNTIVAKAGAGTTAAITVTSTPDSIISNNIVYGSGSTVLGISVGAGSLRAAVRDNLVYGCVTDLANAVSNTVPSAARVALPSWTDSVQISGSTNITSIAAGSANRGRTVTLMFQGPLTVTTGGNLKLKGHYLTTADDTLTLTCSDGANWFEIARSAN